MLIVWCRRVTSCWMVLDGCSAATPMQQQPLSLLSLKPMFRLPALSVNILLASPRNLPSWTLASPSHTTCQLGMGAPWRITASLSLPLRNLRCVFPCPRHAVRGKTYVWVRYGQLDSPQNRCDTLSSCLMILPLFVALLLQLDVAFVFSFNTVA
jgi:hypothetical protein